MNLKTMPFGTQEFTYHLDADFFNQIEKTEVRRADVNATLVVTRKEEDYFQLKMACHGTLVIPCDRCLDDMEHEVDTDYQVSVRQEGTVLDDSLDELLLVPTTWRELDVAPLLRDTVLLTIPLMHTHEDPGMCNAEMMGFLCHEEESDNKDAASDTDPRWDVLRQLKE